MTTNNILHEAVLLLRGAEALLCDPRAGAEANQIADTIVKWLTDPVVVSAIELNPEGLPVLSDDDLRSRWREAGGSFHGPIVETGTMPESQLLPFLRDCINKRSEV